MKIIYDFDCDEAEKRLNQVTSGEILSIVAYERVHLVTLIFANANSKSPKGILSHRSGIGKIDVWSVVVREGMDHTERLHTLIHELLHLYLLVHGLEHWDTQLVSEASIEKATARFTAKYPEFVEWLWEYLRTLPQNGLH